MSAQRDLDREHKFLSEAAGGAGIFTTHVEERLAEGEERFGSSWAWIGVRRHLRELCEEAADLAAWAVLCDQALDHEHGLTDAQRSQARAALVCAARYGARAHEILSLPALSLDGEQLP